MLFLLYSLSVSLFQATVSQAKLAPGRSRTLKRVTNSRISISKILGGHVNRAFVRACQSTDFDTDCGISGSADFTTLLLASYLMYSIQPTECIAYKHNPELLITSIAAQSQTPESPVWISKRGGGYLGTFPPLDAHH